MKITGTLEGLLERWVNRRFQLEEMQKPGSKNHLQIERRGKIEGLQSCITDLEMFELMDREPLSLSPVKALKKLKHLLDNYDGQSLGSLASIADEAIAAAEDEAEAIHDLATDAVELEHKDFFKECDEPSAGHPYYLGVLILEGKERADEELAEALKARADD